MIEVAGEVREQLRRERNIERQMGFRLIVAEAELVSGTDFNEILAKFDSHDVKAPERAKGQQRYQQPVPEGKRRGQRCYGGGIVGQAHKILTEAEQVLDWDNSGALVADGFGLTLEPGLHAPEPSPRMPGNHRLDHHTKNTEVAGHCC